MQRWRKVILVDGQAVADASAAVMAPEDERTRRRSRRGDGGCESFEECGADSFLGVGGGGAADSVSGELGDEEGDVGVGEDGGDVPPAATWLDE